MRLEYQILAAVALDLAVGDPRWLPHPVRGIGRLAAWLESATRRTIHHERVAGVAAALAIYAITGGVAYGLLRAAAWWRPWASDVAAILIIYSTVAARDLAAHSMDVFRALRADNLADARRLVGRIVGRDTANLDEAGVVRAAVESVAESTVDGVTAPLFFALIGGPVAAIVYRAINTLDSMFGHQDERYRRFGWAAARIDDVANYLPARLTAPLLCLAAALLCQRPWHALRIAARDGDRHASPNSGLTEAAMAGALGVQLGGVNYYDGVACPKPTLGDALVPCAPRHIPLANALMLAAAALFLATGLVLRCAAGPVGNALHGARPIAGASSSFGHETARSPIPTAVPAEATHE
jgi:adenosylcobinamide-phosphate synthase